MSPAVLTHESQTFKKTGIDFEQQKQAFASFCSQNTDNLAAVRDTVMIRIPLLQSLSSKLRCINVPERLTAANRAAVAAAAVAASEPEKATMNDSLYARATLFMVFSGIDPDLADLFNRYFTNEHSRSRAAMESMTADQVFGEITNLFNTCTDFDAFCTSDDTISKSPCLSDIFHGIHPEHLPSPGPVTSEQLMTLIRWSRRVATRLISMQACKFVGLNPLCLLCDTGTTKAGVLNLAMSASKTCTTILLWEL